MRLIDADALKDRMHDLYSDTEIKRLYNLLGIDSAIDAEPTIKISIDFTTQTCVYEFGRSPFTGMYIDRSSN